MPPISRDSLLNKGVSPEIISKSLAELKANKVSIKKKEELVLEELEDDELKEILEELEEEEGKSNQYLWLFINSGWLGPLCPERRKCLMVGVCFASCYGFSSTRSAQCTVYSTMQPALQIHQTSDYSF